jgi:hypothetical protein
MAKPKNQNPDGPFFFDANALTLPTSLMHTDFRSLAMWCEHFSLPLRVTRVAYEEMLHRSRANLQEIVAKIKPLKPFFGALDDIEYEQLEGRLMQVVTNGFKHYSVEVIENHDFDRAEMIRMAVQHIPPFPARRDQGFKDAVILDTILHYCQETAAKNAYVISGDGAEKAEAFSSPEVKARFAKANVNLTVFKNVSQAESFLKSKFKDEATTAALKRIVSLMTYITKERAQLQPLLDAARRTPDFLYSIAGKAKLSGALSHVISIDLVKLSNAYFDGIFEGLTDGEKKVTCDVVFKIKAHFLPMVRTTSVFQHEEGGLIPLTPDQPEGPVEIDRTLGFSGTVNVEAGAFKDLKLDTLLLDTEAYALNKTSQG